MDDSREGPLPHLLLEDGGGVLLGIAGVDDDRQPGLACRGDMGPEARALPLAVAMVVIIIEAALADPDHPRMRRALRQQACVDVRMPVGLVRMDSDRGPDVGLA